MGDSFCSRGAWWVGPGTNFEYYMPCSPILCPPDNRYVVTALGGEVDVEDGITRLELQRRVCMSFKGFHKYLVDLGRQARLECLQEEKKSFKNCKRLMPNIIMILIILPHYTASSSKVRNQYTDEANHFHICLAPEPGKQITK